MGGIGSRQGPVRMTQKGQSPIARRQSVALHFVCLAGSTIPGAKRREHGLIGPHFVKLITVEREAASFGGCHALAKAPGNFEWQGLLFYSFGVGRLPYRGRDRTRLALL